MKPGVFLLILTLASITPPLQAQPDDRDAAEFFKHENYLMAIPEYKNLLKVERDHPKYNYYLGLCYLRTNIDRTQAVYFLEKSFKTGKAPADILLQLAQAYAYDYNFDKAIAALEDFLKKASGQEKNRAQKLLDDCRYARENIQKPINISFENLGRNINSEYADYYPFVSGDETFLAFNSRRKTPKGQLEFDGYYNCDIYTAMYNGEVYTHADPASAKINSQFDDQVVGMSPEGDMLFVFSQAQATYGALYLVPREGSSLGKKEQFITAVHDGKSIEISGYMSPDGQTIVFSSNRTGGMGGFDLWMVRKLPTGAWAIPQNLGPLVNTPGDEDFPSFSFDGTTLYFSSNGHPGMGGFDLYNITWNPEDNTYYGLTNMGYPLNTPEDERTISYTQDGKHAYVSALRKGGLGDLDLYRVTFGDIESEPAIYSVKLPSGNTNIPYITDAVITVLNDKGTAIGEYRANPVSGSFTIALYAGNYTLDIKAPGYQSKKETLKINEFTARQENLEKLILLEKR